MWRENYEKDIKSEKLDVMWLRGHRMAAFCQKAAERQEAVVFTLQFLHLHPIT